jgi:hypothetical protein
MKRFFILFITALFFVACATKHPGRQASEVSRLNDLALNISSVHNEEYSDPTNIFLDLVIENTSNSWIHIDRVDVDFPGAGNAPHNIIVGKDLEAWAQSFAIRKKQKEANASLGIAGLILAGTVMMVAAIGGKDSVNSGLASLGAATTLGGAGLGVHKNLQSKKDVAERADVVPETHLFAPVTIPSNGVSQRWILINTPAKIMAQNMRVRIHTVEGGEAVFDVPTIEVKK